MKNWTHLTSTNTITNCISFWWLQQSVLTAHPQHLSIYRQPYSVIRKPEPQSFVITSSNTDRFSELFHWHVHSAVKFQTIIIKDPITPLSHRYACYFATYAGDTRNLRKFLVQDCVSPALVMSVFWTQKRVPKRYQRCSWRWRRWTQNTSDRWVSAVWPVDLWCRYQPVASSSKRFFSVYVFQHKF